MAQTIKIRKESVGKIAYALFDDHAENSPIIECEVWGKVIFVDDKQVVIRSWNCVGFAENDQNHEHFSIVRSAIKKFRILK